MRHVPGCNCCGEAPPPCFYCDEIDGEDRTPYYITATINGVPDTYGPCAAFNGQTLQMRYTGPWCYGFRFGGHLDEYEFDYEIWLYEVDGSVLVRFRIAYAKLPDIWTMYYATWEATIPITPEFDCCEDFDGVVLSYVSDTGDMCDFTGSTVTINAVCAEFPWGLDVCSACIDGNGPQELAVTFTGAVSSGCTDCPGLINKTFVLPFYNAPFGNCVWRVRLLIPGQTCSGYLTGVWVTVTVGIYVSAGRRKMQVYLYLSHWLSETTYFEVDLGSEDVDCFAIDNNVPLITPGFGFICNTSAVTCHVTAV